MSNIIGETSFKERPDISNVFIRQIDRTNNGASISQVIFQSCVETFMAMLPKSRREWVYQNKDMYESKAMTLLYRRNCGVRMGTKNAPLLRDPTKPVKRLRDNDGRDLGINWTDPNIISPVLREVTTTDYQKMYECAMTAAEYAGLTWQIDPLEVDAGDTIEYIEERKRTPWRYVRENDDN